MTQAQARASADRLKAIMTKWRVRCSIELVGGRGPDPWAVPAKPIRFHHHTVSRYSPGGNLTPCLGICKNGRSDVPGPLCNGYGGYDLVYRIICMGLANHPGLGGPLKIDGVYIPKDSARTPTWGTEWEGGLQSWEEIDRLGPDMLQFMGRVDNALAEWSSRPLTSQCEHKTWAPTRKVDRLNFDRARGIALTQKWSTEGEDDMFGADDEKRLTWILQFLRGSADDVADLGTSLDRHIKAVLEKELSTSGSVTRQKVRELAFLGAEDAEDNDAASAPPA
jgi:hypothetical protein